LLINIGIAVLLGLILYTSGFSARMNRLLSDSIPFYTHTLDLRGEVWMRPQEGFLSGEIVKINEDKRLIELKDLNGDVWSIEYANATVKYRVVLNIGERIKILGIVLADNTFKASEIRPWEGLGRRMQEN